MYEVISSKQYRKSLKRLVRSGSFNFETLDMVINLIRAGATLEPKYRNHPLQGEYAGCCECHIKNNLLLIYEIDKPAKKLIVINIGSHAELFE